MEKIVMFSMQSKSETMRVEIVKETKVKKININVQTASPLIQVNLEA